MSVHRWMKFWPADWHGDKALRTCSPAARGMWMDLICMAHEGSPYGHVTINGRPASLRQIAAIVGVSEKEAGKLLGELDEAGVCSRTDAGAIYSRRMVRDHEASLQGKKWVETRYANKGDDSSPMEPPTSPPTREATSTPTTLEARSKKIEAREEREELPFATLTPSKPPVPKIDPLDWARFWEAYPRKVGKDGALKAYTAAIKRGADPVDILRAVQTQRWSSDVNFIAFPATWLNQGRWQDDPEAGCNDAPPTRNGPLPRPTALGSFLQAEREHQSPYIDAEYAP